MPESPIVYHGTFEEFKKFDKSKMGSFTGAPSAYEGFFFATNRKVAVSYASDLTRQLREYGTKADLARKEIVRITGDSYFTALHKIYLHSYPPDIDKTVLELNDIILKYEDLEAGVESIPMGYDYELDPSGRLIKARLDLKNPFIYDMKGEDYRAVSYYDLIKKAKSGGYDGLIIKNTYDGANPVGNLIMTDIYVAFDESQIKIINNKRNNATNTNLSTERKYARIFGLPEEEIAHADYDIFTGILTVTYGIDKPRYKQKKSTQRATKEFADYFKAPIFIGKSVDYILTAYLKAKGGMVRESRGNSKSYYTSTDPVFGRMTIKQFIETEVKERGNYTLADVQNWMRKYGLSMNDLALWVSPLKWVANRYNLLAEEWDEAENIPESEMNVTEIKAEEGFIIPESDDGEAGYLFVFNRPKEGKAVEYMVYEGGMPAGSPGINGIVNRIIQEVKEKPWTVPEKRAEIVARLKSASDEIDRKIVTEIRSFRPLGTLSEFGAVMGAEPRKGVRIDTIMGATVFDEKRVPSKERVARWDAEHKTAEIIRGIVSEYAFALEARPNTVTGNFRVVEHARRLKAQGLLTPEEEHILTALEKYWQDHPELDRQKGYGIWGNDLEIMVPESLRKNMIEQKGSLIDAILKASPGELVPIEYKDVPLGKRILLPSNITGSEIQRRGDLIVVAVQVDRDIVAYLYVQKGPQLIQIRPIPRQKMQIKPGESVNTPEYNMWVERIKKEAPEYLPEWEITTAGIRAGDTIVHKTAKYTAVVDKVHKNGNADITVTEAKGIPEWEKSIKEGFPIKTTVKGADIDRYFEKAAIKDTEIKQPWQMTKHEAIQEAAKPLGPTGISWGEMRTALSTSRQSAESLHKDMVKLAIVEGKPVPPEVLKDYRDLATVKKQPWEMTYREFADLFEEVYGGMKFSFAEKVGKPLGIQSQAGEPYHMIKGKRIGYSGNLSRDRWRLAIVDKALSEGKKVPEDVLAELSEKLKEEREKLGGTGMAEQQDEVGSPYEVKATMSFISQERIWSIVLEDYSGYCHGAQNYPRLRDALKDLETGELEQSFDRQSAREFYIRQIGLDPEDPEQLKQIMAEYSDGIDPRRGIKLKEIIYSEEVKAQKAMLERQYTKQELNAMDLEALKKIAIAKGAKTGGKKEEVIDAILLSQGGKTEEPEKPPSQEVKDWMKRALGIEDYKGGRHDRIQMLALLIQNSELGNIRSISEAGSMALALGKDLGYGTPPPYGISFERYYAEKIAAETGKEVPIIKSSAIIKPPLKQVDPEVIAKEYLKDYNMLSLRAVTYLSNDQLASDLISAIEGLSKDDALKIAPQVRALANAKAKEMEAREMEKREKEYAEWEKKEKETKQKFWNEVKDLKITDVQVEWRPGEAARGYRNIYLNTYVVLENGKRVRMNEEIFKGSDVAEAQKLGLAYFRKRKLYMVGETVGQNVRDDSFLSLNRYDDYVKQVPVPVQKRFEETGPIAGGTPARQILAVTQPEEYYFGTQVEVMQGADPELEPYFTGTIKRLLNNGELVEVHPEGEPAQVSFRVPVDRVNVVRLVEQQKPGVKPKKEIWQMTQREFNSTKVEKWQGIRNDETKTITGGYLFVLLDEPKHEGEWVTRSTGHSIRNVSNRSEAVAKFHKEQVEKALSEGKLVPEEVLKDYPELVKPKEGKKLYRYYYRNRPPGIGTQPEGFINHETWMPARTTPHGRTAFGWVEYDRPLTQEEITGYELFEDEVELPKLVRELVQFAKTEGIDEAMKELTSEYGRAVWDWLKSQKRLTTRGQKEQIRDEIMRLAGISAAPPAEQPDIQTLFDFYIRSTMLTTGALASPKFLNDEAMAQDIFKNIKVSIEEARALVPQFRAIAEKRINKEEIESVKETFGIDLEQEAHNFGIDLADYAIIKAGNKVILQHKTIVQRSYEIKPPKGYMEERERRVMSKHEAKQAVQPAAPPAAPVIPPVAKPVQTIHEIKQQILGNIQAARTVEELQQVLKGIGFLPLPAPEKQQVMDAYQNKFSTLMSERQFGVPVKIEKKPAATGAPTRQQLFEAELRRKAEEARRVSVTPTLTGGAITARRLEMFEPGAMEKAKAEADVRKRIEQLGLPSTIHPLIQRLAASTQEILKFGSKRGKETVEDLVLRRYVQYCPPGTIIDNRNVPKVLERWWVYPPKLRTCITQVEQKLAEAGAGLVRESQRFKYSIYQDGGLFANENDPTLAEEIYNMLVRTYPKSTVELRENFVHPAVHQRVLKQYPMPKKYPAGGLSEFGIRENVQPALTPSMRSYIRGAQAVRDVIHYFRDNRPPIRGVLYRARAGGYFVEAQDGQTYSSIGWEDVSRIRMPAAGMATA